MFISLYLFIFNRPDPTPEAYVDEDADFFSAAWRFGKKK